MKKFLLLILLLLSITTIKLSAQSCFNVSAGKDTIISCLANCLTLKARIPDVRTSETYQVISIPYTPYLYTTPGGTTDPLVNADDHFSDSFFLPFPFCFYGNTYTKICVGSNAVITFDVLLNAKKSESFFLTAANKLPYAGGGPNNPGFYAPRASIFLAYYDMNPATSPPGNKIEWRVEGTAPCRRFVVSFYHIGYFGTTACPNTNPANLCTMQAVLYEGTGLIDVFYENKPACPGAPGGGLSIAGIQNWGQNQAVWPTTPNTNSTIWTAVNQGFRYVPSGTGSLFNRVELYKNGTLIATDLAPTVVGNGELEANFPNICQAEDSMSYVIRAFYHQCDNPAIETEGSDTIIVYKDLPPIVTNLVDAACNGSLGKITVVSPYSPPDVEYSIDGGVNWQTFNIFNVPAGSYTVLARKIGNLCTSTSTVLTITQPPVFAAFATPASAANCNTADGSLSISASGGTLPYQYSLDGGFTWQPSNIFSNLAAGNYSVRAKDAHNCLAVFPGIVPLNDTMTLDLGADSTICFGSSITLNPIINVVADSFKWTPSATLNYDTAKNPVASPTDTTKYFLTAKKGTCVHSDSVTIKVLHKPVVYAGSDTSVCYKTMATLMGSATNLSGTVNYAWSPVDSLNMPNAATTIARIDTTRQFKLSVTDNYGCNFSVSDSMWVFMHPLIFASAGNDTNAIINRQHELMGSGGANYSWSPAGLLNDPFIANPLAVLTGDTYFRLIVSDAIGCFDVDTVFIKVYEGPMYYLPNAFTPNGDGLNDIFRPTPVGIRSTDYFRIFDRYGALMFETKEWMKGWDGTLKSKPASSGTYAWMIKGIDKNGAVIEMKGTVILIR
ncbi:MAG: T9SS type B sorting domain-containing protein [Ferruginibacter sp.]